MVELCARCRDAEGGRQDKPGGLFVDRNRLSEDELALFDLLAKDDLSKRDREAVKRASRRLMAALQ